MGAHISVPMYQRALPQRYRLIGQKCLQCGEINFPPRAACGYCRGGFELEEVQLSGKGSVYSYTVIAGGGVPPEFEETGKCKGSYPVAIVELDEGPRVIAQLVNPAQQEITIGTPVEMVFRKIYEEEGVIRYGFKFKPVV